LAQVAPHQIGTGGRTRLESRPALERDRNPGKSAFEFGEWHCQASMSRIDNLDSRPGPALKDYEVVVVPINNTGELQLPDILGAKRVSLCAQSEFAGRTYDGLRGNSIASGIAPGAAFIQARLSTMVVQNHGQTSG